MDIEPVVIEGVVLDAPDNYCPHEKKTMGVDSGYYIIICIQCNRLLSEGKL